MVCGLRNFQNAWMKPMAPPRTKGPSDPSAREEHCWLGPAGGAGTRAVGHGPGEDGEAAAAAAWARTEARVARTVDDEANVRGENGPQQPDRMPGLSIVAAVTLR